MVVHTPLTISFYRKHTCRARCLRSRVTGISSRIVYTTRRIIHHHLPARLSATVFVCTAVNRDVNNTTRTSGKSLYLQSMRNNIFFRYRLHILNHYFPLSSTNDLVNILNDIKKKRVKISLPGSRLLGGIQRPIILRMFRKNTQLKPTQTIELF